MSGIRFALLLSDLHRGTDLNQRPFSDARAESRRAVPFLAILHQFRPERKRPALRRLRGMDAASMVQKERALLVGRLAESQLVARAIDVFLLERARRHAGELRRARQIVSVKYTNPD